jgi:hypothetical protein
MNLEHFKDRIKYRKKYYDFIAATPKLLKKYREHRKAIKKLIKRQMAYGALTFEMIEHTMYGVPLYQEINIKYTKQIHNPQINDPTMYDYFRPKKFV